jgi:hypothetical protein
MAEVGLVKFATLALRGSQAVLSAYRSTFSKHRFQQPQRLAIVGLRRYEAWTFRAAEVRLAAHAALRTALGARHVPDYTTGYRFLRRLDEAVLEQLLSAVVQRLVPQPDCQAPVAVDVTGLAPGAVSTFVVQRAKDRGEGFTWRHGLKWTLAVDVDRRLTGYRPTCARHVRCTSIAAAHVLRASSPLSNANCRPEHQVDLSRHNAYRHCG